METQIVVYPKSITNEAVIYLLEKKLKFQNYLWITDNENKSEKDFNFIKCSYYQKIDEELWSLIKNSKNIIIDDLIKFFKSDIKEVFRSLNFEIKIFVLTSLGITEKKLKYMKDLFIDYKIISLNFIPDINFNFKSEITNNQYNIENNIYSLFNYTFENKNKEDLLEEEGGWINKNILNDISKNSPKINKLINILILSDQKHLISFTKTKKNGLLLFSSILSLLNLEHIILTGDDSPEIRYKKIDDFNKSNIKIICTSVGLISNLDNIKNIHLIDNPNKYILYQLINHTCLRTLHKNDFSINIYLHIQYINEKDDSEFFINDFEKIFNFYKYLLKFGENSGKLFL